MTIIYRPVPFRPGNKVVKQYTVDFIDKAGNMAEITKIDYMDKKKKIVEGFVMYVKWIEKENYEKNKGSQNL